MPEREPTALLILAIGVVVAMIILFFWRKGRRLGTGDVFRASRLSSGNHLFPTQVAITPASVVHYTPRWIGRLEHSIHIAHVASVRIVTNLLFADVYIETTGGHNPISCHGHHKRDAVRMKDLIEQYQSEYYRREPKGAEMPAPVDSRPTGR